MREKAIKVIAIFAVIMTFAHTTSPALALYVPPVPPVPIIRETFITVSFVEPQKTITLNVTQIDPEQVVKNLTITFIEPVLTATLKIYHLAERPPGVPVPPNVPLLYFTISAPAALLENVEKAVITFAVEKAVVEEKGVGVETIVLNRFFEGVWEELPTRKVAEDAVFIYFEAESPGLSHFAVTGVVPPFPWWIVVTIVIVVAVLLGIYFYRRAKLRA